jgi:hypothetical protein
MRLARALLAFLALPGVVAFALPALIASGTPAGWRLAGRRAPSALPGRPVPNACRAGSGGARSQ